MFDFTKMIGTMVVCVADPLKSYIVGASEGKNEEFQKGICTESLKAKFPKGSLMELPSDCYERFIIDESLCGNYNDILNITGMPGSIFGDANGHEVRKQIVDQMYDYYLGKIPKNELLDKVKDICKDMRVYQAQSRHTSGCDKKDNLQILKELYELFQKQNVNNAAAVCFEKGENLALQNGGTRRDNWVYYDSDYYYESEEMREELRRVFSEMAQEWETDVPDFTYIEENTHYSLDGKMDFNSVWNWMAMNRYDCTISNYKEAPPKNFSFFYQETKHSKYDNLSPLERQKGIVQIIYGDRTWKLDVPFNNSLVLGNIKEKFNAKELLLDYFNQEKLDSELLSYLEKFDVFTRAYGQKMGTVLW